MCAARVRRLPGFRFETQAPALPEILPRMDIAVFVGFAASGPLQIPVAIESEAQFSAIFGGDAPLAWDVTRGEQLYAYLGPAVRAFFRNNGKRCWVIRVARQEPADGQDLNYARYNHFPIPALARAEFSNNGTSIIGPAFARARAEGSWSDRVQVSSALFAQPLSVQSLSVDANQIVFQSQSSLSDALAAGDLLRLTFDGGRFVFLAIDTVTSSANSPPTSPLSATRMFEGRASKAVWFKSLQNIDVPIAPVAVKVGLFTAESSASLPATPLTDSWFGNPHNGILRRASATFDGTVGVELSDCVAANAPSPGSLVRLERPNHTWWMTIESTTSKPDGTPVVFGRPFRSIAQPGSLPTLLSVERLSFEIWVRKDQEYSISISDLGFANAHERFWGKLPTDEEVYGEREPSETRAPATILWTQVGDLFRFPLAGVRPEHGIEEFYFPLAMPLLPENYLGAININGSALERDGLADFDESLFLDRDLIETQTMDLAGEAEYLMYLAPEPRRLTGIHAAFPLEEGTIISVPDAVHRDWSRAEAEPLAEPKPSPPPPRPQWWHFLDCWPAEPRKPTLQDCEPQSPPASTTKAVHEPEWGNFLACSTRVIEPPTLTTSTNLSDDGTFTLSWSSSPPIAGSYILQESGGAGFSDAEAIYSGKASRFTLYGRKAGDYFYRVCASVDALSSDWSNGVAVRVGEAVRWASHKENEYSPEVLFAVQRSLLRMCAARGDLVCLLSLPEHYREDDAITHAGLLKSTPDVAPSLTRVKALSFGEILNFTYGALFHPWLIEVEEDQTDRITRMPPCGAVAGLFADRAVIRGAWIAPANQPLRGVVALEPPLQPSRRFDLQEAHINVVRQEPRGFLVLDAETLSDDPDLIQMNVRRLLILLRRQALRLGATYVFEPNSPAFRRAVDRGFTEMLDGLFERGAFAGATPASAYQVVTDASLNTPQSVDQGRFIVELRVAPSLPMTFLTIRLIQTSDRSLAMEVR